MCSSKKTRKGETSSLSLLKERSYLPVKGRVEGLGAVGWGVVGQEKVQGGVIDLLCC